MDYRLIQIMCEVHRQFKLLDTQCSPNGGLHTASDILTNALAEVNSLAADTSNRHQPQPYRMPSEG
jgi:hypothetical protein